MNLPFCLSLRIVFITLVGAAQHAHAKTMPRSFTKNIGMKFVVVPLRPLPSDDPKHLTNSIGMKFVRIIPGTFMMGSPKEEAGRDDGEARHKVTLTKGFYMGVHLVTQEQWRLVMGNNPSAEGEIERPFDAAREKKLPVATVSWEDCQEFIKKLREKDKRRYRLPTEAEWEFCCRAGSRTPFHFGDTISTHQANYESNETTPVGSFPANAFGLYDMHGNLWQWCQDWHGEYPHKDVIDPQGPNTGKYRVLRGGSWGINSEQCRSASRNSNDPGIRLADCGFRIAFCLD